MVTIDTTASDMPATLALAPASDTGLLGDDLTMVTTPAITGTATVGDTVTLYDGTVAVGSALVGTDGTWSVTSTDLTEGPHILTAIDTDPAGNASLPSAPLVVTIDTTASDMPATLALAPASDTGLLGDDLTKVTTPAITGTATAGDTVTLYDGTVAVGSALVGTDGTWSVTSTDLTEGPHILTAIDTDPAGNASLPSAPLVVTIDDTASDMPATLALAPASDTGLLGDDLTMVTTPAITGTATVGDTVTLYDGTVAVGSALVGTDGTWSVTSTDLTEGPHILTAVDTDPAGNASLPSAPLVVTIDTTASDMPATLALAPASDTGLLGDDLTMVTTPAITGTATAGDTVTLYDGTVAVGSALVGTDGTWSVTSTDLTEGPHILTAVDTDPAGNASLPSAPLVVTIDTTASDMPATLALAPASDTGLLGDDLTMVTTPAITGTATAGDTVTLYDGTVAVGSALVGTDGTWSVTSTDLTEGPHILTAVDTDPAGNASLPSAPLVVTIDTTASDMPATLALAPASDTGLLGDDLTMVTTPAITGTATAGDTVTLYDGTVAVGSALVGTDGTWSVTSTDLTEGPHILTAVDTDPAGNASLPSAPLVVTIDTTASDMPATLALAPASDTGLLGDDLTMVTTPAITGTATAGDTVTLYDGTVAVGSALVGTDGTWSVTSTDLTEGPHILTAVDTDPAGNASLPSAPLVVTIDTTASDMPATLALAPASDTGLLGDDLTMVTTPAITGTATAGDTVTLYDGTVAVGSALVGTDGTWSVTSTDLTEGPHILTAVDTDPAGNASLPSAPLVVTIDDTAPTVSGVNASRTTGTLLTGDTVTITVAMSKGVQIAGGAPTLALNNGEAATYDAADFDFGYAGFLLHGGAGRRHRRPHCDLCQPERLDRCGQCRQRR